MPSSNLIDKGRITAICPKCNEPREMPLIFASTSFLGGVIRFHRKYVAVCEKCSTVYNVEKKKGDSFSLLLPTSFTQNDFKSK